MEETTPYRALMDPTWDLMSQQGREFAVLTGTEDDRESHAYALRTQGL